MQTNEGGDIRSFIGGLSPQEMSLIDDLSPRERGLDDSVTLMSESPPPPPPVDLPAFVPPPVAFHLINPFNERAQLHPAREMLLRDAKENPTQYTVNVERINRLTNVMDFVGMLDMCTENDAPTLMQVGQHIDAASEQMRFLQKKPIHEPRINEVETPRDARRLLINFIGDGGLNAFRGAVEMTHKFQAQTAVIVPKMQPFIHQIAAEEKELQEQISKFREVLQDVSMEASRLAAKSNDVHASRIVYTGELEKATNELLGVTPERFVARLLQDFTLNLDVSRFTNLDKTTMANACAEDDDVDDVEENKSFEGKCHLCTGNLEGVAGFRCSGIISQHDFCSLCVANLHIKRGLELQQDPTSGFVAFQKADDLNERVACPYCITSCVNFDPSLYFRFATMAEAKKAKKAKKAKLKAEKAARKAAKKAAKAAKKAVKAAASRGRGAKRKRGSDNAQVVQTSTDDGETRKKAKASTKTSPHKITSGEERGWFEGSSFSSSSEE